MYVKKYNARILDDYKISCSEEDIAHSISTIVSDAFLGFNSANSQYLFNDRCISVLSNASFDFVLFIVYN